jgi:hypothetical protein
MSDKLSRDIAVHYLGGNFAPSDRLAIVLVNHRGRAAIQRIASAEGIAQPDFQAWLEDQNEHRFEIYISMNALHPWATGRTKQDVAQVRHIYLDFDENGTGALKRVLESQEVPTPNYVISSSPEKWQTIWKVDHFGKEEAERLQKALASQYGADRAATDCARVLRLPGFLNHKYVTPHRVSVESLATQVYGPMHFPEVRADAESRRAAQQRPPAARSGESITQSERDWAFAKRALARGDSPELVIAAIAQYRRFDKHNPQYYAELTVQKAAEPLGHAAGHPKSTHSTRPQGGPAEDRAPER